MSGSQAQLGDHRNVTSRVQIPHEADFCVQANYENIRRSYIMA